MPCSGAEAPKGGVNLAFGLVVRRLREGLGADQTERDLGLCSGTPVKLLQGNGLLFVSRDASRGPLATTAPPTVAGPGRDAPPAVKGFGPGVIR